LIKKTISYCLYSIILLKEEIEETMSKNATIKNQFRPEVRSLPSPPERSGKCAQLLKR
jgi:hypothetical protein